MGLTFGFAALGCAVVECGLWRLERAVEFVELMKEAEKWERARDRQRSGGREGGGPSAPATSGDRPVSPDS